MVNVYKSKAKPLVFHGYDKAMPAVLHKTNHNVDMVFEDSEDEVEPSVSGGYLGDDEYQFEQLHLHWGRDDATGSEHWLNGREYPGEAHFVHFNKKYENIGEAVANEDGLVVLGFFLEISSETFPGMQNIIEGIDNLEEEGSDSINLEPLTLNSILNGAINPVNYVFYNGSLTTPPCAEVVSWHVFLDPIKISREDIRTLRTATDLKGKLISGNDRPIQPINGREVLVKGHPAPPTQPEGHPAPPTQPDNVVNFVHHRHQQVNNPLHSHYRRPVYNNHHRHVNNNYRRPIHPYQQQHRLYNDAAYLRMHGMPPPHLPPHNWPGPYLPY